MIEIKLVNNEYGKKSKTVMVNGQQYAVAFKDNDKKVYLDHVGEDDGFIPQINTVEGKVITTWKDTLAYMYELIGETGL